MYPTGISISQWGRNHAQHNAVATAMTIDQNLLRCRPMMAMPKLMPGTSVTMKTKIAVRIVVSVMAFLRPLEFSRKGQAVIQACPLFEVQSVVQLQRAGMVLGRPAIVAGRPAVPPDRVAVPARPRRLVGIGIAFVGGLVVQN